MRKPAVPQNLKRRILKDSLREDELRDAAFRRIIRSIPKGKVSTTEESPPPQVIRFITGPSHGSFVSRRPVLCLGNASWAPAVKLNYVAKPRPNNIFASY